MKQLKLYITEFKTSNGINIPSIVIPAFNFKEAEAKIRIYNKTALFPVKLIGQWIKDV